MEKQERVVTQVSERDSDDVASAREARMRVPYSAFRLKATRAEPLVREVEALTAVIVLEIFDAGWMAVFQNGDVLAHAIGNIGKDLRKMKHRVGVVIDAKQQDLAVKLVDSTNRAPWAVDWKAKRIAGDQTSFGSPCCHRKTVLTS